jgi:FkbM family methyltransferase
MKQFSESLRYDFPFDQNARVIDVGCHEANWSLEMWRRYGCQIIALEPINQFFWNCTARTAGTGIKVMPFGLSHINGMIPMRIHGSMSGMYCTDGPEEKTIAVTPRALLNGLGWEWASLLKLNCEGAEYDILESAICSWDIHRFLNIHVQFHTNAPDYQARFDAIARELAKTHTMEFNEPYIWTGWKRIQP